jgi:hypothetical protein
VAIRVGPWCIFRASTKRTAAEVFLQSLRLQSMRAGEKARILVGAAEAAMLPRGGRARASRLPKLPRCEEVSSGRQRRRPCRFAVPERCRLQAPERLRTAKLARRASAMDGASHAEGGALRSSERQKLHHAASLLKPPVARWARGLSHLRRAHDFLPIARRMAMR